MQSELENGLILRTLDDGTEQEKEALPPFYLEAFKDDWDVELLGNWARDFIKGHPTTTVADIFYVIDPKLETPTDKGGQIVSAIVLIPQKWHFGNGQIPLSVGRIELVATLPDYQNRGLVRALMNAAHQVSAERGDLLNVITGIPYYYRKFGYAMAVDLGIRGTYPTNAIDAKKRGEHKPEYQLREATVDDCQQLADWDAYRAQKSVLSHVRTPELWRYEIETRTTQMPLHGYIYIIQDVDTQQDVGYVAFHKSSIGKKAELFSYVVGEESSYLLTFEDVMRGLKKLCDEFYVDDIAKHYPDVISIDGGLPRELDVLIGGVVGRLTPAYAWFMRVPDMAKLLKQITPVLEQRLEDSVARRYTGTLKIGFHNLHGVVMQFDNGKITDIEYKRFKQWEADIEFPDYTFINVLFGHRNLDEIAYVMPDAWGKTKAKVLIASLFPKGHSWLWGLV